jgi:hypothetical protein
MSKSLDIFVIIRLQIHVLRIVTMTALDQHSEMNGYESILIPWHAFCLPLPLFLLFRGFCSSIYTIPHFYFSHHLHVIPMSPLPSPNSETFPIPTILPQDPYPSFQQLNRLVRTSAFFFLLSVDTCQSCGKTNGYRENGVERPRKKGH